MTDTSTHEAIPSSTALPVLPHQTWYAVALSAEVPPGEVIGVPFASGRLAVFRRSDGTVVALSSRCAHMGADLAAGDVVDDDLRCMFHHFCYGADGRCTSVPSGDRIPARAQVHSFPVRESVGLVWIFNGDEPPAGPPGIVGHDPEQLEVRARRTDVFEVDPWVIIANSFDFMHLRYVHDLTFDFDESTIRWGDSSVEYEMSFTMPDGFEADQRIRVSGTNTVSYVTGGDSMGLFTSTPIGIGSQSYYIAASPRGEAAEVEERLQLQEHIADALLEDDTRALAGMRFQQGALVSEDRSIVRYLQYIRQFPTNDPTPWLS